MCHNSNGTLLTTASVQPTMLCAATTKILQSHYPERLGLAVCYSPPKLFSFTWRVSLCAWRPAVFLVAARLQSWSASCLGHPLQMTMCFGQHQLSAAPAAVQICCCLLLSGHTARLAPMTCCCHAAAPGYCTDPGGLQPGAGVQVHWTLRVSLIAERTLHLCGLQVHATPKMLSCSYGVKQYNRLQALR